jgi:hypothetical protein
MSASHARQKRPLFPVGWSVKALADALRIDRGVIYEALRVGDLIAYRVGTKNLILTGSRDEPGTIIAWIASHRKVKRHEHT